PGEADDERPVDAIRVQDRERVADEFLFSVGLVGRWPIRLAVAAGVEGEHPRPAGEVRDLRLPAARVDDRPGGQEEDCRLTLAAGLPVHTHAAAVDETRRVGVAGARLLAASRACA